MNRNSRYPATFREEPVGERLWFSDIEPVWEQQKGKLIFRKLLTEVTVIRDK